MDGLPQGLNGLDTTAFSTVGYPSCVFLLERAGVFTYERFAYDALRIGVEVLNAVGLPDQFDSSELETVDKLSREALKLFVSAGLVPVNELNVLFDDTRFADIRRAAAIVQELDIAELQGAQPLLAQLRALHPESAADVNALRLVE